MSPRTRCVAGSGMAFTCAYVLVLADSVVSELVTTRLWFQQMIHIPIVSNLVFFTWSFNAAQCLNVNTIAIIIANISAKTSRCLEC